jgi:ribosomal RNA assembly protein
MPDTEYLKIPRERVGVVIGKNGITKDEIENLTKTEINVDSEAGSVAISPTEKTEDPLAVWKARYIVKAIGTNGR